MHRFRFTRLAPLGTAFILAVVLPGQLMAQAAQRTAPDRPSQNRETLVQHDSLAVHFLRTPKAKPTARQNASKSGPSAAKFRGRPEPIASTMPVETPLPTKKAAAKR
jgi:hypothetical protein